MTRELITSWSDYQSALDRLLALPGERIDIYDEDLEYLRPETPARLAALKQILAAGGTQPRIRIAVRNADALQNRHPHLMNLLGTYGHLFIAQETPQHLAHLRDAMVIIDNRHALIRFDKDQPRSKLLIDEQEEISPYRQRFDDIIAENGKLITRTTLGL
jgi:hypothetical protein